MLSRSLAVLVLVSTGCATPPGTFDADARWTSTPPMRAARAAHAVVSTDDAIYALGGTGAGGRPVLGVERFDGTAWREETTLPGSGLNAPAAVVLGDALVVIGGFETSTNVPTDRVLAYDTRTHAWRVLAPLPAPRGGHAAVMLDGRIHVIGGGNDRTTLSNHDMYDPASNAWIARAPLPRAEGSPAAVVWNGKLYAIGGRSGPADFGAVDIYDPVRDRWTAGPPIEPRGTAGAVVYCGAILVFGGESQARRASLGDVLRLTADNAWQPLAPMPTPRNFARAVVLHDAVYVVGGSPTPEASHASQGSAIVERFSSACSRNTPH